ncbi:hypothetical protein AB1E18_016772 [Capra hircus]
MIGGRGVGILLALIQCVGNLHTHYTIQQFRSALPLLEKPNQLPPKEALAPPIQFSLCGEHAQSEDGPPAVRQSSAVEPYPNQGEAAACAVFAQLPACRLLILEGGSEAPRGS